MGLVKRFDLKRLKTEFNCSSFFETGTWKGDSVAYAAQYDFEKIFSSEIMPEIADRAAKRFADDPRITIITENSVKALEDNISKIKGNCIFWLDAHFPGSEEGIKGYNEEKDEILKYPLKKELEVIAQYRSGFNDVLLIDDLRIYEENNYANGNMPENIERPQERNAQFVEVLFDNTHNIFRSLKDEGYIYALPKTQSSHISFLARLNGVFSGKIY